jgi:hypothetical protein
LVGDFARCHIFLISTRNLFSFVDFRVIFAAGRVAARK